MIPYGLYQAALQATQNLRDAAEVECQKPKAKHDYSSWEHDTLHSCTDSIKHYTLIMARHDENPATETEFATQED